MATTIGHACHDENNKYSGGSAGDQTGGEVCTRTWYSRPWTVVLRPTTTTIATKLVTAMKAACANNKIGYDQNQRNTILTQAKKYSYDLSKITTACECDCSSLVSVCCVYAGISLSTVYSGNNLCTTSTLQSALKGTGKFTVLTDSKYLTSSDYLKAGDILLYPGHHVAINLTNGAKVTTTSSVTYFKACSSKQTSLVDGLKSIGATSTLAYRKKIAVANGLVTSESKYTGQATYNTKMLNLLKKGTLIKP